MKGYAGNHLSSGWRWDCATTRYLTSNWAAVRFGTEFPMGTLLVNVVGDFIIGLFMALITERLSVSPYWRLFIAVGFLGGLTTFSSFSYEALHLLQNVDVLRTFYNVGLNVLVGFLATWLGMGVAKLF
ncbi:putative membrane protein [Propionispora sp. 2/2-37]|uniref:fluoride efflux transporter CrcB n=1 Tax=Propionispora sp. 2/2-37 TaxID=1677858 RepID=UPI0006C2B440|nr:fluoride efflux transporter CrcB [Propionispora sp. 2/2-37]CUH96958.1 putative membrane protein [Propionispora sp. 2/2-37]